MLDAKHTLHFHSIGVRDRIVFLCSSFEFYRSHTLRSERNIQLEHIPIESQLFLFIQRILKCLFYFMITALLHVRVFSDLMMVIKENGAKRVFNLQLKIV